LTQVVVGQQRAPDLPPDHQELYYSFFMFTASFGQWLDLEVQKAPERKSELMQSAARYLKVDVKELPRLIDECKAAAAALQKIENDAHQRWNDESNRATGHDPSAHDAFIVSRQAAIQAATAELKQALSEASWNGLSSHINGEHRLHLFVSH